MVLLGGVCYVEYNDCKSVLLSIIKFGSGQVCVVSIHRCALKAS